MTRKEKLRLDHPEWSVDEIKDRINLDCPWEHGIENIGCDEAHSNCDICWNMEIPDDISHEPDVIEDLPAPSRNPEPACMTCVHSAVCRYQHEFLDILMNLGKTPWIDRDGLKCKHYKIDYELEVNNNEKLD